MYNIIPENLKSIKGQPMLKNHLKEFTNKYDHSDQLSQQRVVLFNFTDYILVHFGTFYSITSVF